MSSIAPVPDHARSAEAGPFPVSAEASAVARRVDALVTEFEPELVATRREIHAQPELSWTEHDTTTRISQILEKAGLTPRPLDPTGLVVDIGPDPRPASHGRVALRADLDALPIPETSGLPFASTREGVSHACGHDVHTAALLGAALTLARLDAAGELKAGVRCVFQPAEEVQPGGGPALIEQGVLDGVGQIYALHCAPRIDIGKIGSRIGTITAAGDTVTLTVTGQGGHTSRPHMTGDVIHALGQLATGLPSLLGRRTDPRAGVNLTWGAIHAGSASNAMPASGTLTGTLRCLDVEEWHRLGEIVRDGARHLAAPLGVEVDVDHARGIPPVVNDERSVRRLDAAAKDLFGADAVQLTEQSLGGEDFAWYLTHVPGALVRLGTRSPDGPLYDLHRGDVIFDERAIGIGARLLARTALMASGG